MNGFVILTGGVGDVDSFGDVEVFSESLEDIAAAPTRLSGTPSSLAIDTSYRTALDFLGCPASSGTMSICAISVYGVTICNN